MLKKTNLIIMALILTSRIVLADNINGINIEFVNIVNAGNVADSTGYGAVGYNYRIGQTEVSISQFEASGVGNGNEGAWSSVGAGAPASYISWHEAARYCNWLTSSNANNGAYTIVGGLVTAVNRASAVSTYGTVYVLPTEDEWYKAAYYNGASYSLYANGTGTAPVAGLTGANYDNAASSNPWIDGSGVAEANNTYDLMGNIWEWTESAFDGSLDAIGEDIAFRGGAYSTGVTSLESTSRALDTPSLEHQVVGMRIVAIPEPGTISLMSLSTISLFFVRTIRRRKLAGKSLLPIGREHLCDTFSSYEEWEAAYGEVDGVDYLAETKVRVSEWFSSAWSDVTSLYKTADKMFWSRMVVVHERKIARKAVVKAALKKRALACFDAFLALIMK